MLSHKQSFVNEQEKNMLHPWSVIDVGESFSELSLVLCYQGGPVLRGRKGAKREEPLLSFFLVCLGLWCSAGSVSWGGADSKQ